MKVISSPTFQLISLMDVMPLLSPSNFSMITPGPDFIQSTFNNNYCTLDIYGVVIYALVVKDSCFIINLRSAIAEE